eukprot:5370776-Amphidinium_carterae.1
MPRLKVRAGTRGEVQSPFPGRRHWQFAALDIEGVRIYKPSTRCRNVAMSSPSRMLFCGTGYKLRLAATCMTIRSMRRMIFLRGRQVLRS